MSVLLFITLATKDEYEMNPFQFIIRIIAFAIWTGYSLPLGMQAIENMPILPIGADKLTTLLFIGAVIWSNVKFREGHKYQGPAGVLNSYMFGFYMFYIAFTYGLLYAIIVHFLFDLFLFSSEHLVQIIKNWRYA